MNTYILYVEDIFAEEAGYSIEVQADDIRPVGADAGVIFLEKNENGNFDVKEIAFHVDRVIKKPVSADVTPLKAAEDLQDQVVDEDASEAS